jgi:hypothetical protein
MAHVYIITSATHVGDICTITGTVDGIPVTITPWFSAISDSPSTAAVQIVIAPQMLAAAISAGGIMSAPPVTLASVMAAGTWTV